jgi:hypothetical protein
MGEARERLNRFQRETAESLLGERRKPWGWESMSESARLDHIADRILAEDRGAQGITGHRKLRETGILSVQQMKRRQSREVYSNYTAGGGLDDEETPIRHGRDAGQGVFGRTYARRRFTGATARTGPPLAMDEVTAGRYPEKFQK